MAFFRKEMKHLLMINDDFEDEIDDDNIVMKTKKDLFNEAGNEECNEDETESDECHTFFYHICPCIERIDLILNAYQKLKQNPDLWVCIMISFRYFIYILFVLIIIMIGQSINFKHIYIRYLWISTISGRFLAC